MMFCINFLGQDLVLKRVTIGLFEAFETSKHALVKTHRKLLG
jgi:hypothetical protein